MPNEKLEKLKHDKYVAERKLTATKHKENKVSEPTVLSLVSECLSFFERTSCGIL